MSVTSVCKLPSLVTSKPPCVIIIDSLTAKQPGPQAMVIPQLRAYKSLQGQQNDISLSLLPHLAQRATAATSFFYLNISWALSVRYEDTIRNMISNLENT